MSIVFGIIGAAACLLVWAYEEKHKKFSHEDETKIMYMTAIIIVAIVAILMSLVFASFKFWEGVILCLAIVVICGISAISLYNQCKKR